MNQFIDVNNRAELRNLLLALGPITVPLWGKMKPQQMVEHLVEEVKWTNGKKAGTCGRPPEDAERGKQKMVYTDAEVPKNVYLEDLPQHFAYPNIEAAVNQLMNELDDFDEYFKMPGITAVHGGFGAMDYNEWVIYHGKHFTHHLKQFGLIPG